METLKYSTAEEVDCVLSKNTYDDKDLYVLYKYVSPSLVEYCNDIRNDEINEVKVLEEYNLRRFLNATSIMLRIDTEGYIKAITNLDFLETISEINKQYRDNEAEGLTIVILTKMLLALGSMEKYTPLFEGNMPQKFMSFRNHTANQWFNEVVSTKLQILYKIFLNSSYEGAKDFLFANLAFQLHYINPNKYIFIENIPLQDSIKIILNKFLNN